MKKILFALALSALMTSAQAWEFDMAEVTCDDIKNSEQGAMMMFWLDGYISAAENDTVISSEWLDELGGYLEEGCGEGNGKVLDIIRAKYLNN